MGASRRGVCQGARLHSDLREREPENCPLGIRVHELNLAAVRARVRGRGSSRSRCRDFGGVIGAEEALEKMARLLGREAGPVFATLRCHARSAAVSAMRTAGAVILHGVVEQVAQDLGNAARIHARRSTRRQRAVDADPAALRDDAAVLHASGNEAGEVVLVEIEREPAGDVRVPRRDAPAKNSIAPRENFIVAVRDLDVPRRKLITPMNNPDCT